MYDDDDNDDDDNNNNINNNNNNNNGFLREKFMVFLNLVSDVSSSNIPLSLQVFSSVITISYTVGLVCD